MSDKSCTPSVTDIYVCAHFLYVAGAISLEKMTWHIIDVTNCSGYCSVDWQELDLSLVFLLLIRLLLLLLVPCALHGYKYWTHSFSISKFFDYHHWQYKENGTRKSTFKIKIIDLDICKHPLYWYGSKHDQ